MTDKRKCTQCGKEHSGEEVKKKLGAEHWAYQLSYCSNDCYKKAQAKSKLKDIDSLSKAHDFFVKNKIGGINCMKHGEDGVVVSKECYTLAEAEKFYDNKEPVQEIIEDSTMISADDVSRFKPRVNLAPKWNEVIDKMIDDKDRSEIKRLAVLTDIFQDFLHLIEDNAGMGKESISINAITEFVEKEKVLYNFK